MISTKNPFLGKTTGPKLTTGAWWMDGSGKRCQGFF